MTLSLSTEKPNNTHQLSAENLKSLEDSLEYCFQPFDLNKQMSPIDSNTDFIQKTESQPSFTEKTRFVDTAQMYSPKNTAQAPLLVNTAQEITQKSATQSPPPTSTDQTPPTNAAQVPPMCTEQTEAEPDAYYKTPSKPQHIPSLPLNSLKRPTNRSSISSFYSDIQTNDLHRATSSCLSLSSFTSENLGLKKTRGKKKFFPTTKESLVALRQETAQNQNPRVQLDFARQLLDAANNINDSDTDRVQKARERLIMEAQRLVKKLASHSGIGKQGYPEAQFFLANCYGTGNMGLAVDPEKAFGLYLQGSKQNHPQCTFRAAVCYEVGAGTKLDKDHAIQFYRKAANLEDPIAMYKLGMILLKGFLNQPVNPREGIIWLKRAAEHANEDHPHALYELGLVYEKEGIPSVIPDLNYARELFTQAAQYGYVASQVRLGQAYENGYLNCPVDPRRSIAWYSKAAEQGNTHAEFSLSGWYLTGSDGILSPNDTEAYKWAKIAADKGFSKAEYAVGYYTETGTGTEKNLEEAIQWYIRAANQNHTKAMQRLIELKYEGTSSQQHSSESKKRECEIM